MTQSRRIAPKGSFGQGSSFHPLNLHSSPIFILFLCLFFTPSGAKPKPSRLYTSDPIIRVNLSDNMKKFSVQLVGKFNLKYQNFTIATVGDLRLHFEFSENGVPFVNLPNQKLRFSVPITIEPVDSAAHTFADDDSMPTYDSTGIMFPASNGETFPGSLKVIPERDSTFTIVNIVPLETYLRGVVPNELVNNLTPDEFQACIAQSIAARNFAFYKMGKQDTSEFDVYSDTRDQVYSGKEGYKRIADSAIALSYGMIVEYNGSPARCFFHSTCGGHTENVQNVWQGQPALPYLSGVSDIDSATGVPFCADSPNFSWITTFTLPQLNTMLKKNLGTANPTYAAKEIDPALSDIEIVDRFQSSRIDSLEIETQDGKVYIIRGDRIRYFFKSDNGTILKSDLFHMRIVRNSGGGIKKIVLAGHGSGHGVGMCQWGAIGMSRLGYNYSQILQHYYPGTEIKKIY
jgi:stage II sporulation protein D